MSNSGNLDVRVIANALLREAWGRGLEISNLKMQKLLFLCQAFYLIKTGGNNLIRGNFEAWQFGPVHREAYDAFKNYADQPITTEAQRFNPVTQERIAIDILVEQSAQDVISDVIRNYAHRSAAQLVELTHTKNGPWDYVVTSASSQANMALKISNDIIKERFKYHWFGTPQPIKGKEPDDEKILIA